MSPQGPSLKVDIWEEHLTMSVSTLLSMWIFFLEITPPCWFAHVVFMVDHSMQHFAMRMDYVSSLPSSHTESEQAYSRKQS